MNYRDLNWSELRAFATSQGINTKGKKKVDILAELDGIPPGMKTKLTFDYKGIKDLNLPTETASFKCFTESHPFFKDIEEYIPYLKAYDKSKSICNIPGVSRAIATIFMTHIEENPRATLNLTCGRCVAGYYRRTVAGYNRLAKKYGRVGL